MALTRIESEQIKDGDVVNADLADMAADTIKGRSNGSGTGAPEDLTATQVRTIINVADGANVNDVAAEIVAATAKSTPIDADSIGIVDSADSNNLKETTVAELATKVFNNISLDEDTMATNSATKVPTQQSTKAYADNNFQPIGQVVGLNVQSGTTYTLVASDAGKIIRTSSTTTVTITIPYGTYPDGTCIYFFQDADGQIVLSAAANVSLIKPADLNTKTRVRSSLVTATLYLSGATDYWLISGDMELA